jgi:hypothetical protein
VSLSSFAQRIGGSLPPLASGISLPVLEHARLEGARLALRTIRHMLGNKLAIVVGYSELLADDPRLPPDLRARASQIATSAMNAADDLHRFDDGLVRLHVDNTVAGPGLLDVERSTSRT